MRWLPAVLVLYLVAAVAACSSSEQERASRIAVKRLLAAPDKHVGPEMERVVAYGAYVLVDLEQEFHGAEVRGRLRLLEALRRIGSAEALPFVRFVARWDTDKKVRQNAGQVGALLQRSGPR